MKSDWLSFCDETKPKGFKFLGVSIVRGLSVDDAIASAHALRCNPGGEVLALPIVAQFEERIADQWRNRLLSKAECDKIENMFLD